MKILHIKTHFLLYVSISFLLCLILTEFASILELFINNSD